MAGPHTWQWLSSVSLLQALYAGVLFCGHSNHTVEPITRIRPDRAVQALLPGYCPGEEIFASHLLNLTSPARCLHILTAPRVLEVQWQPMLQLVALKSGKRRKNIQAQAKGGRERNSGGRAAHHAEDELTTLQLLSGTSQATCHQPVWDRLPLPSSTQLYGQDHFQLHPTTLLGFLSFSFLLIQLVSNQVSQKGLFIHFAVEKGLCPSLLADCSTWHCTALWVKTYVKGKEILLPCLCSSTQSWIRSVH